ncbi:MAG: VCBS repeat-containing protein [Verrucomicrobiota bacterium]
MQLPDLQQPQQEQPTAVTRGRLRIIAGLAIVAVVVAAVIVFSPKKPGALPEAGRQGRVITFTNETVANPEVIKRGEQLARGVCATCHLFPEPHLLDRFTWAMEALPRMHLWLGFDPYPWEDEPGGKLVKEAKVLPEAPIIGQEDYQAITTYYLATAPLQAWPQTNKPPITVGLKHFQVVHPEYRYGKPMTTLVKIDSLEQKLYISDSETKEFVRLNSAGKVEAKAPLESPAVHMVTGKDGFLLTLIGELYPSDDPKGKILFLPRPKPGATTGSVELLKELPRPTSANFADLNQDATLDLVVSCYGNLAGRFSWFEQKADRSIEEHVLLPRHGAVRAEVHDFNGDGRADIVVMMAQGREGLYLFENEGGGKFKERTLFEFHPAWGSSYFELVDFNGDGAMDIVATNGDNGDLMLFPPCSKNYHGVRVYLNDGKANFHAAYFYPMYGAYRARALDFDLDGDIDIAAIAFFPDYGGTFKECFAYLENKGNMQFAAFTFSESISGRWMTFDAGDLDGDGDPDIALGAFNRPFNDLPGVLLEQWEKRGPSVLILKNTIRP